MTVRLVSAPLLLLVASGAAVPALAQPAPPAQPAKTQMFSLMTNLPVSPLLIRIYWKERLAVPEADVGTSPFPVPVPGRYYVGTWSGTAGSPPNSMHLWIFSPDFIQRNFVQTAGMMRQLQLSRETPGCDHSNQITEHGGKYRANASTQALLSAVIHFGDMYATCRDRRLYGSADAAKRVVQALYALLNAPGRSFRGQMCLESDGQCSL